MKTDSTDPPVSPTELRDYAKALGWLTVPEAVADRLYVLHNPRFPLRQLVIPMDTTVADYAEAALIASQKLAELEALPLALVLAQVQSFREDTLSFRVQSREDAATLPLTFAAALLSGAELLLRTAASTVLKPQPHHPRMGRSEAQRLIEVTRFQHTQPGSFVVKVACPVRALDVRAPLLPGEEDAPFVRRTTNVLYRGLRALVTAIEADQLAELTEQVQRDPTPVLSSNLCEALGRFQDAQLANSLEVRLDWSLSLPRAAGQSARIRIQQDYFPRIEEVRQALRPVQRHAEDTFIGTVEQLGGEMEADGRRAGEVVLALLLPDAETIRVRVHLDPTQYAEAHRAHMRDGAYVQVTGKLHPGRQPRPMTEITRFAVVPGGSASGG